MAAGSALLLFIVQTSFWDRLAISGAKPEFMVIMVVYLAFYHRYLEGAGLVLLLGYLTGFYSSLPLGVNLIGLALVHYLCVLGVRAFFLNSVLFQGAVVFSGVLVQSLLTYLVLKFLDLSSGMFLPYILFSSVKAAYSGVLAPVVFYGLNRLSATPRCSWTSRPLA